MALLWSRVKDEFQGVVDDFRQKGAAGALYDAALDVRDLAKDAGDVLIEGAKFLVSDDEVAYAQVENPPEVETLIEVHFHGSERASVLAEVVAVDTISKPPRARVRRADDSTCFLIQLVSPGSQPRSGNEGNSPSASETGGENAGDTQLSGEDLKGAVTSVLTGLGNEFRETVSDFKEKGAATTLKDAALDAVDLVGVAAGTVASYSARGAHKATQLASRTVNMLNSPPKASDPGDWYGSDTEAAQRAANANLPESTSSTGDAQSSGNGNDALPSMKLNLPPKESDPETFVIGTARRRESIGHKSGPSSTAAKTCDATDEEELID